LSENHKIFIDNRSHLVSGCLRRRKSMEKPEIRPFCHPKTHKPIIIKIWMADILSSVCLSVCLSITLVHPTQAVLCKISLTKF